jgi:hypothetical protein
MTDIGSTMDILAEYGISLVNIGPARHAAASLEDCNVGCRQQGYCAPLD